ncbi:sulfotransferase [Thalassotalea insulae]|uniref:sulfotransferase n=1 Tax=Thalassotalea insulae TaxID=2056778 RepID=UPI0024E0ABA6|nr:sulfotransferase [Thalassotalea insulae]
MTKYHFISGLPRSGSTLLAGILRQHPHFYAAMSSPIGALINSALKQMGRVASFILFLIKKYENGSVSLYLMLIIINTKTKTLFLIRIDSGRRVCTS